MVVLALVLALLALLGLAGLRGANRSPAEPAASAPPAPPPRASGTLFFRGDFESGGLDGWAGDLPHPRAAEVVDEPVRRGRYAVRLTVAPGDRAASKERAELRLADKEIERRHGGDGQTLWYGMSLLLPAEHEAPPGAQYPILVQWHHRPAHVAGPGHRAHVTGPPPLALYLLAEGDRQSLRLVHQESPAAPPRGLGERPVERGRWLDLVFEVRWSTGPDGLVRAWLDGAPLTDGDFRGPTLYNPLGNYLRFGYYRGKGGTTTDRIYFDQVRIGDSRSAVTPGP